jgi:type IV pilus assembly protein PilN
MAKINLLPWRDERRAQRKREFFAMIGAVVVASVLVAFLVLQFFEQQIAAQNDRNSLLTKEITDLDKKIKDIQDLEQQRDRLLTRQRIIENLQSNRSTMVHLFDELVMTIPDGVYLMGIKQSGNNLELEGRAQSNARVAQYMRNLEASAWMKGVDLQIVQTSDQGTTKPANDRAANASIRNNFKLRLQLDNPNAPASAETDAASGPPGAQQPSATTGGPK